MKRSRKILAVVLVVVVVVGAGCFIWNINRVRSAMTASTNTPNMTSIQVDRGDISVLVSGNGKIEFSESEDLIANIEGKILSVNIEEGAQIKKNDVIAEVDIDSAVVTAENDIKLIQSKIKLQGVTIKGQENSLLDLDYIKNNSTITSPYSGALTVLSVVVGDNVNQDQKIGTVDDTSKLRIVLPFEKERISSVKPGQKVDVYLTDYVEKGVKSQGQVQSISISSNGGQEIVDVEVVLENQPGYEADANASFSLDVAGNVVAPLETGVLEIINSYTLVSQGSGRISKILKEVDDPLTEGDVILELENKTIDLDVQEAQYNLESTKIELDSLKDQLTQAQKNLEDLKADSILLAPIGGVVTDLNVKPGDHVTKESIIAHISDTSKLIVPVSIDELDIAKVETGQTAAITLDALEKKNFMGSVEEIALEGTNESGIGMFEVKIMIANPIGIKPGMSSNVEILVAEKTNTLILPIEAIQKSEDEYVVMVKSGKEPSNQVQVRNKTPKNMIPIQVGLVNEDYVEVLDGLVEGDEVLILLQSSTASSNQMGIPGMSVAPGMQDGNQKRSFTQPNNRR